MNFKVVLLGILRVIEFISGVVFSLAQKPQNMTTTCFDDNPKLNLP